MRGAWCRYCVSLAFCEKDCDYYFSKSLASDARPRCFVRSESGRQPHQISKKGSERYTFKCETCDHEFTSTVRNITFKNNWCGFCGNQKWCEDKNCIKCFNASFASNEKAQYIVDKTIDLSRVRKTSPNIYEFCCEVCNNMFSTSAAIVSSGS